MKRLLVALTIALLLPLAVFAQSDRAILLTNDGTLYSVESSDPETMIGLNTTSSRVLMMTTQNGAKTETFAVPASLNGGSHSDPALAYDSDSDTLFVFWEAARNGGLASDLMFCSYHEGRWSTPAKLDSVDWDLRKNFRIAITRKTEQAGPGGMTLIPEINVHAVWWQVDNNGYAWARYAMLTLEKGNVTSTVRDLASFLSTAPTGGENVSENEILHHPVVFESANRETVDVVFGDTRSDKMHRVTIKPVANGRLRIPVGVRDTDVLIPVLQIAATSNISAVGSVNSDNIAFYFDDSEALSYTVLRKGVWSELRTITLNERVTRDAARDALTRMVNAD